MSVDRSVLPKVSAQGARIVADALVERLTMDGATIALGHLVAYIGNIVVPKDLDLPCVQNKSSLLLGVHSPALLQSSGIGKRSKAVGRHLTVHLHSE